MGKVRERQITLKTDHRTVLLELGQGEIPSKSAGWDENRIFLEGDVLEVSVRNGRWVLTSSGQTGLGAASGPALLFDRGVTA
jgi:hypothetical protein